MKILFVFPFYKKHIDDHPNLEKDTKGYFWGSSHLPGLGIPILASLTPSDIEIEFIDDNYNDIDFDMDVSLVAISAFTPQISRAYQIATEFRKRNVPVVLGGKHPSIFPEEAIQYADYVMVGEGEGIWQQFIEDFRMNRAKKIYKHDSPIDITKWKQPNRRIFNFDNYPTKATHLQIMRGCSIKCETCTIPTYEGTKFRLRSVQDIVDEVNGLEPEIGRDWWIYIANDELLSRRIPPKYVNELLDGLASTGRRYQLSTTLFYLKSYYDYYPDILDRLYRAGVHSLYFVYAVNMSKYNMPEDYIMKLYKWMYSDESVEFIYKLQDKGIDSILPSVFLGEDFHDKSTFDTVLNYLDRSKIKQAEFTLHTPYPGTLFFKQCQEEKRLLHTDWKYYNSANVVFQPKHMKPEELLDGFYYCWKEFFKDKSFDKFDLSITNESFMNGDYSNLRQRKLRELEANS